ncbi:uncharacterized protein LOC116164746 [Photinus pyralis]|uniref:uncharacterized protein LOC116164746 n=1 Tax=Photinus pyralis TaxID=7054 RepID=UPI0012675C53|nr:uncharacterized protein LOC116164746 [Photinus pyralis]
MFTFPTDQNLKKKWETLLRRADRQPNRFSVVCACQFVNRNRENLPTLFKRNNFQFSPPPPEVRKRQKKIVINQDTPVAQSTKVVEKCTSEPKASTSESTVLLQSEAYFREKEMAELQSKIANVSVAFGYHTVKDNNKLVALYTGLPDAEKLCKEDQLLLTLMKLKLDLMQVDLAVRFGISQSTVSNIILTWIHVLKECLYDKILGKSLPTTSKIKTCLPSAFATFTNCRIIIDCTEIYTAVAGQLDKQKQTYSNYKHRNTLKALVGVAPNGVIIFVSDLYAGNTSDKEIVRNCGILELLQAGDLVLADKGFLIADLLPPGVSLNIPPFLMNRQFTPEEIKQTMAIAKARIHVERAIQRIKIYKVLHFIPAALRPYSSDIFKVCACLANMNYPLIKEVEEQYNLE